MDVQVDLPEGGGEAAVGSFVAMDTHTVDGDEVVSREDAPRLGREAVGPQLADEGRLQGEAVEGGQMEVSSRG